MECIMSFCDFCLKDRVMIVICGVALIVLGMVIQDIFKILKLKGEQKQ